MINQVPSLRRYAFLLCCFVILRLEAHPYIQTPIWAFGWISRPAPHFHDNTTKRERERERNCVKEEVFIMKDQVDVPEEVLP